MRQVMISGLMVLMGSGLAMAEPVDGNSAKRMLFSTKGVDMRVVEGVALQPAQIETLKALLQAMRAGGLANYYGAVALSPTFFDKMAEDPSEATLSGLFQVTERLHTPQAAAEVAIAACRAAATPEDAPCLLAAQILQRRLRSQPVSLGVSATEAFADYRRGDGPKAMAISAGTGAYAIVKGEGAAETALSTCNTNASQTGQPDCSIVIAD